MTFNKSSFLIFVFGLALGALLLKLISANSPVHSSSETADSNENKPLYWVAPMDDNYRRDKPGKSPMGMDLVPVYANDTSSNSSVGTVTISPTVINNLGVRTAKVTYANLPRVIKTVGYVKYNEDNLLHIHPRVEGWLERLYVKAAGDPVEQGQPLYSIYSPQLVNAQEEFLIALKRNNSALINAAKQRLSALQLSERFIQDLLENREVQQTVTFYAPKSGVLDGLKIREGFYVNPGNTLMSIAQLDNVWVEAEVFERDTALIKEGLKVSMTLDYQPGRVWNGKVEYIYPALNEQNRTLRVRLEFDNQDQSLRPNMFAQVKIATESQNKTMLVPREAVIRTGSQDRVVLALGQGQFKSLAVTIGQVQDDVIEILAGLEKADRIVSSAHFLIDSESSKTSDFARYSPGEETEYPTATVSGVINSIDIHNRSVNISREAIEKWDRPAATMDFQLDRQIRVDQLNTGQTITFTFEVRDDLYITDIDASQL